MKMKSSKVIFPILCGFFVMGFVDLVGISTNYVKSDFGLSDSVANLLPMMVFVWFALFSIPTGLLMGKLGRRNTVLAGMILTVEAVSK
ncbi:MAG: MFS transporter [Paramuribaculum sp.]